MTHQGRPSNRRALALAVFAAAGVALLSIATAPKAVTVAELGSDWQCHKAAFVLTTCTHAQGATPAIHIERPQEVADRVLRFLS